MKSLSPIPVNHLSFCIPNSLGHVFHHFSHCPHETDPRRVHLPIMHPKSASKHFIDYSIIFFEELVITQQTINETGWYWVHNILHLKTKEISMSFLRSFQNFRFPQCNAHFWPPHVNVQDITLPVDHLQNWSQFVDSEDLHVSRSVTLKRFDVDTDAYDKFCILEVLLFVFFNASSSPVHRRNDTWELSFCLDYSVQIEFIFNERRPELFSRHIPL